MGDMRALTALLLSLVLAVASVSMAVARGAAPMGESVALCIDGQAVTVTLDATGEPVSTPPYLCPDCVGAATAFDLPAAMSLPAPPIRTGRAKAAEPQGAQPVRFRLSLTARGPPALSV